MSTDVFISCDNITPGTAVAKIQQSYDFTLINLLNATTQLMIFVGLFTVAITVNSVIKGVYSTFFYSFPVRRWETFNRCIPSWNHIYVCSPSLFDNGNFGNPLFNIWHVLW